MVKNLLATWKTWVQSLGQEDPLEKEMLPTPAFLGFPGGSEGGSPGKGSGYQLQYSFLEDSMDRGAWWVTVHGLAKSWT